MASVDPTRSAAASARPVLLDLFCGAGGAAMGYHRAGFEVVGVDIRPQPRYPFRFIQADALTFPLEGYDAIHASPPCQAYSSLRSMHRGQTYPALLDHVRARLREAAIPWVIENVDRAPMEHGLLLCGTMFGLPLLRHRRFDGSHWLGAPGECRHRGTLYGVYGNACWEYSQRAKGAYRDWNGNMRNRPRSVRRAEGRAAMEIEWMRWEELTEAIPPAYTEWIGGQLRRVLDLAA